MCQFSAKMDNFDFFGQNLPKNGLGFEILKTSAWIKISILEKPCVPIFRQTDNFNFFVLNLPKNGFWGWNFKNLSPDSESASPRYHVCQFSVKMDNFEFFGLYLGNSPITCNILVLITLRELDRGWNRLDGGGWSWVEMGARFRNTQIKIYL